MQKYDKIKEKRERDRRDERELDEESGLNEKKRGKKKKQDFEGRFECVRPSFDNYYVSERDLWNYLQMYQLNDCMYKDIRGMVDNQNWPRLKQLNENDYCTICGIKRGMKVRHCKQVGLHNHRLIFVSPATSSTLPTSTSQSTPRISISTSLSISLSTYSCWCFICTFIL